MYKTDFFSGSSVARSSATMEASFTVVIKVRYGDTLRRFNAQVVDGELNLSIDGLREKICQMFCFSPETELLLTYVDEDDDVVTLVDDEDLRDMVKQALDPMRITVRLTAEKNDKQINNSSRTSTPLRSPQVRQPSQNPKSDFSEILQNVQEPLLDTLSKSSTDSASKPLSSAPHTGKPSQNMNSGLSQIVKTVQDSLFETLVKLSVDLASKSSSSAPGVADLVDYLSKVSLSYLDQLSDSQHKVEPSTQTGVSESTVATETNDSEQSKDDVAPLNISASDKCEHQPVGNSRSLTKYEPEAIMESNEVASGNSDFKTKNAGDKEKLKNSGKCHSNEMRHSRTSYLPPSPFANNDLLGGKFGKLCSTPVNLPSLANDIPTGAPDSVKEGSLSGRTNSAFPNGLWSFPFPNTSNSLGSLSGPSSMYECPFSGLPVGDMPAASSRPASQAFSVRSSSQNDSSGIIVHRGVSCDGCGVYPIAGSRFKSKVKFNYDLCEICFCKLGNDADYIRMDSTVDGVPILTKAREGHKVKQSAPKLGSRFIRDINIIDGTVMAPLTPFTKIWRMCNNGTALWPQKTQLVWIGGDKLSNEVVLEIEIPEGGLPVNQELDIAVNFIAPEFPGRYISYWRMASPSGQKFGQRFWALIEVDASLKEAEHASFGGLNLNLPRMGSVPGNIYEDIGNAVENGDTQLGSSETTVELVRPVIDLKPNIEHEMKFPINDNLLVGSGMSSADTSAAPTVSYPMIDLNNGEVVFSSIAPPSPSPGTISQVSASEFPEKNEVEEKLLVKLDHMGFTNGDLNRAILAVNKYSLEQAVDDLCAAGEWDHILDDLWEMGFHDLEMNKMLLKKNNGSIKRVVMELIAAENLQ